MSDWFYDTLQRTPPITDNQIAEMRHIEPVMKLDHMFQRIKGAAGIDPRKVSCIWDAEPIEGELFTFEELNMTLIYTQHVGNVFFKPSLAEVYAWLRFFFPKSWDQIRYFHIQDK